MKKTGLVNKIALKIKSLREASGLSQNAFGQRCGFSRSKMQRLETGDQELLVTDLLAIADMTGLNPADLFDEKTDEEITVLTAKYKSLPQVEKDRVWTVINLFDMREIRKKGKRKQTVSAIRLSLRSGIKIRSEK